MNDSNARIEIESQASLRDSKAQREERDDEIQFFGLGSILLEQRVLIARITVVVAMLVILPSVSKRPTYTSDALVVTNEGGGGDARLQGLAGQLGVNLGGGGSSNPTVAPNFLVQLANSRVLLKRMLADTLVTEKTPDRTALLDLLAPRKDADAEDSPLEMSKRREAAMGALRASIELKVDRELKALRISVKTESAMLANHLARRVLEELSRFNLELAQARAGEERRFAQTRMVEREQMLRASEAVLGTFLDANRQFENSPILTFEHDRLQREVTLQQQVLIQLAQSYEDARIREVRDTPILTVIEPPELAMEPDPQSRMRWLLLGLFTGGFVGVFVAFMVGIARKQRDTDNPEARRFMALLSGSFSVPWASKVKG